MSSRWILKTDDDGEPLEFQQLAERLADGTLHDDDFVRPEDQTQWQTVDTVVGLHGAALRIMRAAATPDGQTAAEPTSVKHASASPTRTNGKPTNQVNEQFNSPVAASQEFDDSPTHAEASKPSITASQWKAVAAITAAVIVIGWVAWNALYQQQRFPVPPHVQAQPTPWRFPFLGEVTGMEFALLCFDCVAIAAIFMMLWRRRKRHQHHQ